MIWFYVLYATVGIGVYALLAKTVEDQTGQAPRMGCLMWMLICLAWPLVIIGLAVHRMRARQ